MYVLFYFMVGTFARYQQCRHTPQANRMPVKIIVIHPSVFPSNALDVYRE